MEWDHPHNRTLCNASTPHRSAANEVDLEAQVDAFMKRQAELESGGERMTYGGI
jgi:hypothetical protein